MGKRGHWFWLLWGSIVVLPYVALGFLAISESWTFPRVMPEISISNAIASFRREDLWQPTYTSLLLSSITAATSTVLGFFISRALSKSPWTWLAYLPYILSPIILATSWQFFFSYFRLTASGAGLYLALLFITCPYAILFFRDFWKSKVYSYEILAQSLGAERAFSWRKVVWPLARPSIIICFIQCFLICWFDFAMSLLIGLGKVKTLTLAVFEYVQSANIHLAAIVSCMLLLPTTLLIFFGRRGLVRKWT